MQADSNSYTNVNLLFRRNLQFRRLQRGENIHWLDLFINETLCLPMHKAHMATNIIASTIPTKRSWSKHLKSGHMRVRNRDLHCILERFLVHSCSFYRFVGKSKLCWFHNGQWSVSHIQTFMCVERFIFSIAFQEIKGRYCSSVDTPLQHISFFPYFKQRKIS